MALWRAQRRLVDLDAHDARHSIHVGVVREQGGCVAPLVDRAVGRPVVLDPRGGVDEVEVPDRSNALRYADCIAVQLVTRVPNATAEAVDDLVAAGLYASRSDAVRAGLKAVLEAERRRAVGRAIVDGYRRVPQDADELSWSDAATAAMIADEQPW